MTRLSIFRIFMPALGGAFMALVGCGGNVESDAATVSIDTSAARTHEDVAQALASEHGAPGECEQLRYVLVGEKATEVLATLLHDRGFADVNVGGR